MMARILWAFVCLAIAAAPAAAYEVRLRSSIERVLLPGRPVALAALPGRIYLLLDTPGDRVHLYRAGRLARVSGTAGALHLYVYRGALWFGTVDGAARIDGLRVAETFPLETPPGRDFVPISIYAAPPHGHLVVAARESVDDGLHRAKLLHFPPGFHARYPREVVEAFDAADRIVFAPGEALAVLRTVDGGRPGIFYYDLASRAGFRFAEADVDPRDPVPTADGAVTLARDARHGDAAVAHYRRPNELVELHPGPARGLAPSPWNFLYAFLVTDGRDADLWAGDFKGRTVRLAGERPPSRRRHPAPAGAPPGLPSPGGAADLAGVLPVAPVFPEPDVVACVRRDRDDHFLVLARFEMVHFDRPDAPLEGGREWRAPDPPRRARRGKGLPADLEKVLKD